MSGSESAYRVAHLERARVFHVARDRDLVETTHAAFHTGVSRALSFLGLEDDYPVANLFVLPDRVEFDRFVAHLTPTPTSPGRVGQPQGHDLHLLSPAAYPSDASPVWLGPDGRFDAAMYERLVAHEAVHMVEEHVSPREAMEARPAWWSEGLAVLISEQHRYDHDIVEHIRADLEADTIPGLEEMTGAHAYTWGWTVADFLLGIRGRGRIASMITGTGGADILALLDLDRDGFERDWRSHAEGAARAVLDAHG